MPQEISAEKEITVTGTKENILNAVEKEQQKSAKKVELVGQSTPTESIPSSKPQTPPKSAAAPVKKRLLFPPNSTNSQFSLP